MFGTARSGYNPIPGMGRPRPVIHYMSTPATTRRLSSSADLRKWSRSRCNSADSGIGVDPAQTQQRRTLNGPELASSTRWQVPEPINVENTEARPNSTGHVSSFLQQDNKGQQSMEYGNVEPTARNGIDSPVYTPLPPVQQRKAEETAPAEMRPWRAPGETDVFNNGAVFGRVPLVEQPVFERPVENSTQKQAVGNDSDRAHCESGPAETGGEELRPWRATGETDNFNRGAVFGTVQFVPQPKFDPPVESPRRTKSASPRQTAGKDDSLKTKQELASMDPPPWRHPGETDIFNRGAVFGTVQFVPQPKFDPPSESPRRTKSASPRQTPENDGSLETKQVLAPLDPPPWRHPGETDIFNRGSLFHVVSAVPQPNLHRKADDSQGAKNPDQTGGDGDYRGEAQEAAGNIQEAQAPIVWKGAETSNFNKGAMFHVVAPVPQSHIQREADGSQGAKNPDKAGGDRDCKRETQEAAGNMQQAQAPIVWQGAETSNFNKGAMFHVVAPVPQSHIQREADGSQGAKNPDKAGGDRDCKGEAQEAAGNMQQAQAPIVWQGAETSNFNKGAMFHVVATVPQPNFQREADDSQGGKSQDQDRDCREETQEAAGNMQQAQAPIAWKGAETSNFNKGAMFHVVSSVPQPYASQDVDNSGGPDATASGQGVANTREDNIGDASAPSPHVHWKGAETSDFNRGAVFNTVQSVPPARYLERSTQEQGELGEDCTKTAEGKENAMTSSESAQEKAQEASSRAWAGRSAHGGRDTSRPVLEPLRPTQPTPGAKRPTTKWTTSSASRQSSILRTMNDNVVGPPAAGRSSPESKLPRIESAGMPRGDSSRLRRGRYGSTGGGLTAVDDQMPLPEPSRQAPLTKAVRPRRAVDLPNARCLFNVEKTSSDPWKAGRNSKGKRPFPTSEYVSSFKRWFPSRHYQGTKSAWAHRAGSANSERGFVQPLPDIGSRHA